MKNKGLNKFERVYDYAVFKKRYSSLITAESPYRESYINDKTVLYRQKSDPVTDYEVYRLTCAVDDMISSIMKKNPKLTLSDNDVRSIEIGISLINRIYKDNPDLSLTGAVKELIKYDIIRRKYTIVQLYKFLYTFFSNFPEGYYIYTNNESAFCNVMKINPLDKIV